VPSAPGATSRQCLTAALPTGTKYHIIRYEVRREYRAWQLNVPCGMTNVQFILIDVEDCRS
jgi:hypothetical protein